MYEAREQEDILAELQEASTTPASKIEGTFENDMLASNSIEFAKIEVELEQAYKAAFAETSWGDYLTMIAAEFGVDRKLAVKAKGTVTITGTGDVSVGSRFSTAAGTVFETTETVSAERICTRSGGQRWHIWQCSSRDHREYPNQHPWRHWCHK